MDFQTSAVGWSWQNQKQRRRINYNIATLCPPHVVISFKKKATSAGRMLEMAGEGGMGFCGWVQDSNRKQMLFALGGIDAASGFYPNACLILCLTCK